MWVREQGMRIRDGVGDAVFENGTENRLHCYVFAYAVLIWWMEVVRLRVASSSM